MTQLSLIAGFFMYQDHTPNISRIASDEDGSLKAISLLMNGFPIKINGKELILLDKIYERKSVLGQADVVPSNLTLSEIPFSIPGISDEELNFIVESHRYNIESKSNTLFVTKIISSLYVDFYDIQGKDIELSEYYDSFSLERTSLQNPIYTKIASNSKLRFSSNTLKEPGKRIDRIDSIWEVDIPGEDNKFVWGYGVNLSGELTPAGCRILDSERENKIEQQSSPSY